jgi:hypothetical protein
MSLSKYNLVLSTEFFFVRGCVKSILPPAATKFYFETDVFFMILLRKIMKNTSVSNFNLALSTEFFFGVV